MSLSLLPKEVIYHLASFLIYPDIVALAKVCRHTYMILSPLREILPWKIMVARSSEDRAIVYIKVGWFSLAQDLTKVNLFWKGQSRKKRRKIDIVTTKCVGGPFLTKILSLQDPYVAINSDGSIKDIYSGPHEGSHHAIVRIGSLNPSYCSETSLLSLMMSDLPTK